MLNRIGFAAVLFSLGSALTPTASGVCTVPRYAQTYNPQFGTYAYWYSDAGSAGTLIGQTWQLGDYGVWNDRSQGLGPACGGNLYFGGPANSIGMQLQLASCGTGCPTSGANLAYLAMNEGTGRTDFLLAVVTERLGGGVEWDYSQLGNQQMIPIPRPRVTSTARVGDSVTATIAVDATAGGTHGVGAAGAITGYKILAKSAASDPGRTAAAYPDTLATVSVTNGGAVSGIPVVLDCQSHGLNQWLVTQIVFEGGDVASDAVSGATRINCDPLLADPKFKIVDKKRATRPGIPPKHSGSLDDVR